VATPVLNANAGVAMEGHPYNLASVRRKEEQREATNQTSVESSRTTASTDDSVKAGGCEAQSKSTGGSGICGAGSGSARRSQSAD